MFNDTLTVTMVRSGPFPIYLLTAFLVLFSTLLWVLKRIRVKRMRKITRAYKV